MTDTNALKPDHERIWLQPLWCVGHAGERQWCEDNVWPDNDECETSGVEYIRADLARQNADINAVKRLHAELIAEKDSGSYTKQERFGFNVAISMVGKALAMLTTDTRQTEGLVERDALAEALAETHNERAGLVEAAIEIRNLIDRADFPASYDRLDTAIEAARLNPEGKP